MQPRYLSFTRDFLGPREQSLLNELSGMISMVNRRGQLSNINIKSLSLITDLIEFLNLLRGGCQGTNLGHQVSKLGLQTFHLLLKTLCNLTVFHFHGGFELLK